jgi:hypothetical protein
MQTNILEQIQAKKVDESLTKYLELVNTKVI